MVKAALYLGMNEVGLGSLPVEEIIFVLTCPPFIYSTSTHTPFLGTAQT